MGLTHVWLTEREKYCEYSNKKWKQGVWGWRRERKHQEARPKTPSLWLLPGSYSMDLLFVMIQTWDDTQARLDIDKISGRLLKLNGHKIALGATCCWWRRKTSEVKKEKRKKHYVECYLKRGLEQSSMCAQRKWDMQSAGVRSGRYGRARSKDVQETKKRSLTPGAWTSWMIVIRS